MTIAIHFFGAAGEVTGSSHLLEVGTQRVLLDCGMIQGGREEARRNIAEFGFNAKKIDAVVLSHAHIDHCGRLPLLVKRGFRGRIFATPATVALTRVMLHDSARLMFSDVEYENRRRARRGEAPIEPVYDLEDVEQTLSKMTPVKYGERTDVCPGVTVQFSDAGHIIGSAIVEAFLSDGKSERKLVFSGDLGPKGAPILRDPVTIKHADCVLMESTYGDRLHRDRSATIDEIGEVLDLARQARGNILIPAFAVGRSQEVLYWLSKCYDQWRVGDFNVYLDSPMASKVVDIYRDNPHLLDEETAAHYGDIEPFTLPNLRCVSDANESRQLNNVEGGAIIIAGSGMCNGGRIVHHLKHNLWRKNAHVMIVGYQAQGTLGRALVDKREYVQVLGERIKVNANIHTVGGLSAHADQAGLLEWYRGFENTPPLHLVHGEDKARHALASILRNENGATVHLAQPGDVEVLA